MIVLLCAVVAELILGGLGHLFVAHIAGISISIRMILHAALLVWWVVDVIRCNRARDVWKELQSRPEYLALGVLVLYAIIRGMRFHRPELASTANAWLDLALLPVVIDLAKQHASHIKNWFALVVPWSVVALGVMSLAVAYLFTHDIAVMHGAFYNWIRDARLAEITPLPGNIYRVFFYSDIYIVVASILSATWLMSSHAPRSKRVAAFFALTISSLVLGLSRSFIIGTAVGAIVAIAIMHARGVKWWRGFPILIVGKIVGLACLAAVIFFPFPRVTIGSVLDPISARTQSSEPAASSRMALLPELMAGIRQHPILGSGFGATVTYQTSDPRYIEANGTSRITTAAFEWGWLDFWFTFGIFGIPVMLWVIWSAIKRLKVSTLPTWLVCGAIGSVVALAVVHIFTPYLNHPLGFGILFAVEGLLVTSRAKTA